MKIPPVLFMGLPLLLTCVAGVAYFMFGAATPELSSADANIRVVSGEVARGASQAAVLPHGANDPAYPTSLIMPYCHEKWGSDHRMRVYCEDRQRGAMETAQKESFPHEVRVKCAAKWPDDWTMYLDCARDGTNARTLVHELPLEPSDKIEEHCRHEWPYKPEMEEHCKKSEFEARADVSRLMVQDDVARHCAARWPEQWVMYKDCVERDASTR